jgi:non-specific serine/threonine protein kinase
MALARASLGDEAFARAVDHGRALPYEAAIELGMTVADGGRSQSATADRAVLDGPISPRERDVAVWIARGLTNRQIAAELDLSTRTVDAHVRNILGKLGLASRAQLAAWSVQQGLVPPP